MVTKHSIQVCLQYSCISVQQQLIFSASILTHDHLLAEDLDNTIEAPGENMSQNGNTDPEHCEDHVQVWFSCINKQNDLIHHNLIPF